MHRETLVGTTTLLALGLSPVAIAQVVGWGSNALGQLNAP